MTCLFSRKGLVCLLDPPGQQNKRAESNHSFELRTVFVLSNAVLFEVFFCLTCHAESVEDPCISSVSINELS
jgi:hypothetical protein